MTAEFKWVLAPQLERLRPAEMTVTGGAIGGTGAEASVAVRTSSLGEDRVFKDASATTKPIGTDNERSIRVGIRFCAGG